MFKPLSSPMLNLLLELFMKSDFNSVSSGRCGPDHGDGCKDGVVKYDYVFVKHYCCNDDGWTKVRCISAC